MFAAHRTNAARLAFLMASLLSQGFFPEKSGPSFNRMRKLTQDQKEGDPVVDFSLLWRIRPACALLDLARTGISATRRQTTNRKAATGCDRRLAGRADLKRVTSYV